MSVKLIITPRSRTISMSFSINYFRQRTQVVLSNGENKIAGIVSKKVVVPTFGDKENVLVVILSICRLLKCESCTSSDKNLDCVIDEDYH